MYIGDRFLKIKEKLGVTDKAAAFHSLRKNFVTALEAAGVPESTSKLLTGHTRGITYGLYSPGVPFEQLQKAINAVTFGSVDEIVKERT